MRSISKKLWFPILLVLLAACGTVKVGIGRTPLPDANMVATVTAQAVEYARLTTEVARLESKLDNLQPQTPLTMTARAPITGTQPGVFYQPIALTSVNYVASDFASPLTGQHVLGEVPFELSPWIFKSQSADTSTEAPSNTTLSASDYPTRALFVMNIVHPTKVHLLLNTGNGFTKFEGQVVGRVVAHCDAAEVLVSELELGRDVREWHLAYNVVYDVERATQVWTGALAELPELTGHIDLLSLDMPQTCSKSTLDAIEIIDTSTDTVGSRDPALNLFGITVEYRP